jgi:hypothetical protein
MLSGFATLSLFVDSMHKYAKDNKEIYLKIAFCAIVIILVKQGEGMM